MKKSLKQNVKREGPRRLTLSRETIQVLAGPLLHLAEGGTGAGDSYNPILSGTTTENTGC